MYIQGKTTQIKIVERPCPSPNNLNRIGIYTFQRNTSFLRRFAYDRPLDCYGLYAGGCNGSCGGNCGGAGYCGCGGSCGGGCGC